MSSARKITMLGFFEGAAGSVDATAAPAAIFTNCRLSRLEGVDMSVFGWLLVHAIDYQNGHRHFSCLEFQSKLIESFENCEPSIGFGSVRSLLRIALRCSTRRKTQRETPSAFEAGGIHYRVINIIGRQITQPFGKPRH